MNHISNLALRLLDDGYDITYNPYYSEDICSFEYHHTTFLSVSVAYDRFHYEDDALVIDNFETDEHYQYLDEDTAYMLMTLFIENIYLSEKC